VFTQSPASFNIHLSTVLTSHHQKEISAANVPTSHHQKEISAAKKHETASRNLKMAKQA
jgi:hypothetical protein